MNAKYKMLIKEVINPLKLFQATVNLRSHNTQSQAKTAIHAESEEQARRLLRALYGADSVVSITIFENSPKSPPTAAKTTATASKTTKNSAANAVCRLGDTSKRKQSDELTTEATKTLSADQLRLKSLADQKRLVTQSEQRERDRQRLVKAQQQLHKATVAQMADAAK